MKGYAVIIKSASYLARKREWFLNGRERKTNNLTLAKPPAWRLFLAQMAVSGRSLRGFPKAAAECARIKKRAAAAGDPSKFFR